MRNPLLRTLALSTLFSASLASATDGKTLATAQGIPYGRDRPPRRFLRRPGIHDTDRPGRVVLQTFDRNSLKLLHEAMPQVPKVLLLWVGNTGIASASGQDFAQSGERDKAAFHARQQPKDKAEFLRWLDDAKQEGAIGTGPSATRTHLGKQSYGDLIQPWMNQANHERGLCMSTHSMTESISTRPCSLVSTGFSPTGRESCCALISAPQRTKGLC